MQKIMMIYSIPKGDDAIRIKFNRKLFEYNLQSHKGKYQSKSKGILSDFEKPLRSCVIFYEEKLEKVQRLCDELKVNSKFYKIKKV